MFSLHRLTSEKSRTIIATCARFAASATRLKSFSKASVEGGLTSRGAGGGGNVLKAFVDCVCGQLLAGWACWWVGEDRGASISAVGVGIACS